MRGFAAARVVTCDPDRAGAVGAIADGVVLEQGGRIAFVGARAGAPRGADIRDFGARVITPGLVDAHTHACWVGSRHHEYERRMHGADYETIALQGGGIAATHRAVARASVGQLAEALAGRLMRMGAAGVTTVEVKSGYGLEPADEHKQLAAIAAVGRRADVPDVVPTLLALHALPPSVSDRAAYVARIATELVADVARVGRARFVDAYVDRGAFTADEARGVALAARRAGLGVRLHVGQFADVGGAELAASVGALSADHLEHVSANGIAALARAGVAATLLPIASFTLAQPPPPVAALRAAGVRLVVASDSNPGTAPTESLPLALCLAVRNYGLSTEEAILGATRHAAAALGLHDRGVLRRGARADLAVWDLPHEAAILQPWGVARTLEVIAGGRRIYPARRASGTDSSSTS
jgi:imidazolonepropionase